MLRKVLAATTAALLLAVSTAPTAAARATPAAVNPITLAPVVDLRDRPVAPHVAQAMLIWGPHVYARLQAPEWRFHSWVVTSARGVVIKNSAIAVVDNPTEPQVWTLRVCRINLGCI